MARNLGTLTLDLVLQLAGFRQGMDRAAREAERGAKRIKASMDSAAKGVALFSRGLAALGVGFSVGSIVRGLSDATKEAIEFGDALGKAQAKTGLSAEAISELAAAAKQSEVDLDTLTTALRNMQVLISDAGAGSKEAGLVLKDLGLTFAEIARLAPDKQFELIAQRISEFASEADRAALRQDVFKRAAEGLAPIMEDGARGIREQRDAVRELGATMSQEQIDAFKKADQAIDDLTTAYAGLKRAIGGVLAEPVAEFFNGVAKAMGNANDEALSLGDRTGLLFEALQRAFRDKGILAGPLDLAAAYAQITEEANKAAQATQKFGSLAATLGFPEPTAASRTRTARTTSARTARIDPAPELKELSVQVREITVSATEQLYRDMDAATQTSLERQLAEWEQFTANVQALVDAGRITQEEALKRNAEKTDEFLQEIEITAERMTVPVQEAVNELSVFGEQAARNLQDAFADFLFDPFEDGLDGMLTAFAQTLQRMAAEIVAAQLADKFNFAGLFSGGLGGLAGLFGKGSSAGLSEIVITAARLAEGGKVRGPGTATSDSVPAMLSAGEFVVKAASVRKPGMQELLERINAGNGVFRGYASGGHVYAPNMSRQLVQHFASGGVVQPNTSAATNSPSTVINQSITVHSPNGQVSRATEMQLTAATARGARIADRRNN